MGEGILPLNYSGKPQNETAMNIDSSRKMA